MRQFLESLLLFQIITGQKCPIMKIENKLVRVVILTGLFALLFAY